MFISGCGVIPSSSEMVGHPALHSSAPGRGLLCRHRWQRMSGGVQPVIFLLLVVYQLLWGHPILLGGCVGTQRAFILGFPQEPAKQGPQGDLYCGWSCVSISLEMVFGPTVQHASYMWHVLAIRCLFFTYRVSLETLYGACCWPLLLHTQDCRSGGVKIGSCSTSTTVFSYSDQGITLV